MRALKIMAIPQWYEERIRARNVARARACFSSANDRCISRTAGYTTTAARAAHGSEGARAHSIIDGNFSTP